jgi:sialate O-acetylesterase
MNYVNGVRAGSGSGVLNWRQSKLPAGLLHPGKNSIAIRFIGTSVYSGFTFMGVDGFNLRIGGTVMPLAGKWKMKRGFELKRDRPMPPLVEDNPNWPTTLYNGMMAPLMPMAIKGALWYQGESNVGRGEQYSRLLPAMITDWRKGFGQGDFPFFVVQLANFGGQHADPINSGWAELREAQVTGVSRVKNAGYACIIDIGEGKDIHPMNKQDVGHRLALNALHMEFNRNVEYSGPTFKFARPAGSTLFVTFDHAHNLVLRPGSNSGFQVAGADSKFAWATATLQGSSVALTATGVEKPLWVRYAWDDDPVVTLFNSQGLPAVPFRTK